MEIRWNQDTQARWQARLWDNMPARGALRQDWGFGAVMARRGAAIGRAVIMDGAQEIAAAQVLERGGLRVIGQGPIWLKDLDPAQRARVVRRLALHKGACVMTPDTELRGWGVLPLITPKTYAVWKIDKPEMELRKALQGKWRNRLVNAEAQVTPSVLSEAKLQILIANEASQRRDRAYKNLPGDIALDWPGGVVAMGWHSGGALQAGMVFLIHGQTASYFLGWASPMARAVFAHGPILWQAMRKLRDRDVRTLDLGAVNSEMGASLARFKLGTGAGLMAAGTTCLVLPLP
jgi:hypothetical protein